LSKKVIENFIWRGWVIIFTLFACTVVVNAKITSKEVRSLKEMALIPGGSFVMGSNMGPDDEKPEHTIFIKAFFLDILPVSNADFAHFLNRQGLQNQLGETFYDNDDSDARIHQRNSIWQADIAYASHPVNEVSWVGARYYCAWLYKRLPTEAEWEKAARGIDGRKYPWGNTVPNRNLALFGAPYNSSAPVNAFPDGASPYGILDMAGNQWEWVSSAYQPYPYNSDDGRENQSAGPIRSTRGGGHDSNAQEISTTQRGKYLSRNPKAGHHNIGFRCASNRNAE
jgi:formylglycine-generating enzyme required for sulfatase activity